MMRRFIVLLLLLLAAVWLGLKIHANPGYLLVTYGKWSLETPLWFAILCGLILIFLLLLGASFIGKLRRMSLRLQHWLGIRRHRLAHSQTSQGLIDLAEGRWREAEQHLRQALPHSDTPVMNYLAAARAAQEQGAYERRDEYLQKALRQHPEDDIAISLTQAQLYMSHRQFDLALNVLQHVQAMAPQHPYMLSLLKIVYLETGQWTLLHKLLPHLRKQQILPPSKLDALEIRIYQELLQTAKDEQTRQAIWQELPRSLKQNISLVTTMAKVLLADGHTILAEQLIRDALNKIWDSQLLRYYGFTQSSKPEKQLQLAEHWLKQHPNDPVLLLTLGRLCKRLQLWGKARDYLQASAQILTSAETLYELAQLHEQLGEQSQAFSHYRKGLMQIAPVTF